ncbi:MAG: T9SS type A sorting domain-containing protein [Saprospiraceae bacterium]|nr:T9SS type A sorting domain-containing protein [Saprospiraceae bacterium]MCB9342982.1 T9SS type A sorting domain-containing protein [Lewinellaceae bacterium]
MKHYTIFSFLLLFGTCLTAQTSTDQISAGLGYGKSAFYKLSDGTSTQQDYDFWDIAFSNIDGATAGVFINEGTNSSMGQSGPALEAYDPWVFDFNQDIDPAELIDDYRILNPESSWAEGAFNVNRDTSDFNDYGWGIYDATELKIIGQRVYGLKLRNGQYRKFMIDEFDGSTFKFRVANLDGSNVSTHSITTTPGNGSPIKYFSINNANPPEPADWDLTFCRYNSPLWDGTQYIPYDVTGILSNEGVLVAEALNVDPDNVDYHEYLDSLSSKLDIIGHDWKYYTGSVWTIIPNHAYFVMQPDGKLYKLVFTNFGGSFNGTATLKRTYITQISETHELPDILNRFSIFPNPATDHFSLALESNISGNASFSLIDIDGKTILTNNRQINKGLNVLEFKNLNQITPGVYFLNMRLNEGTVCRKVVFQ